MQKERRKKKKNGEWGDSKPQNLSLIPWKTSEQ